MREDIRIYYRMLRRVYGAYGLLISVAMIGVLPRQFENSILGGFDVVLIALCLPCALALMLRPLSPHWLSFPRGLGRGMSIGIGAIALCGAFVLMSGSVASAQSMGPAATRSAFLLLAVPGIALTLMLCVIAPIVAVMNRRSTRTYGYFYLPRTRLDA